MPKENPLIGVIRLNQVEISNQGVESDLAQEKPFTVISGDPTQLQNRYGSWVRHLKVDGSTARDYYMFGLHYENVDYTLAPGDYVLVYDDGTCRALIGLTDADAVAIHGVLSHENVA